MSMMMPYKCKDGEYDSFRVISLTNNCPFNEIVYDKSTNILVVISKQHKQGVEYLPKDLSILQSIPNMFTSNASYNVPTEKVITDNYYEYYIENPEDMIKLLKYCCGDFYDSFLENIIFDKKL
jgi:hypothetical protein